MGHRPLEPPAALIEPVVEQGESRPFINKRLKAVSPPPAEKEYGVFVKHIQFKLVPDQCGKARDALPHIRITGQNPYIRVF